MLGFYKSLVTFVETNMDINILEYLTILLLLKYPFVKHDLMFSLFMRTLCAFCFVTKRFGYLIENQLIYGEPVAGLE